MPRVHQQRAKQDVIMFWKRYYGSLWVPFEREKITEFRKVKPNENVTISGYVKWIDDRRFILFPTLFSNQIYFPCLNLTEERPRENSYIEVNGKVEWDHIRRINETLSICNAEK